MLIAATIVVVFAISYVLLYAWPRMRAFQLGSGQLPILFGLGQIVYWEPGSTFAFLRRKKFVSFGDAAGDVKTIFGFLGQKAVGPISLKTELMTWEDKGVLTREAQRIEMQVAVWWRIADPRLFLARISGDVKTGSEFNHLGAYKSATDWLGALTESVARQAVNQMGVSEIVSVTATNFLQAEGASPAAVASSDGFEGLVKRIGPEVSSKAIDYGICVERLEIKNIALSPEIQHEIDETRKAFLLPIRLRQEAEAQKIAWEKAAEVLGKDNVALNELLKNFRGSNFFGNPQFLQSLMGGLDSKASKAATPDKAAPTGIESGEKSLCPSGLPE